MTTTRFRWATSARLAGGTLAAVALVAGTVTAAAVTWPVHERAPVSVVATPAPSESVVACPGGLLAIGRDATLAGSVSVVADATTTVGTAAGQTEATPGVLTVPGIEASAPAVFAAPPAGDTRTDLAAASSASVAAEDLSGFAAASCAPPLLESWIVSGSTTTGSSGLLLLANPGTVPATVQITAYGATGARTPPAGQLIVAPGTQRVLPLAGLVRDEQSPVLHLVSTGAPVQASLQASITRTLLAGGVDQVGAVIVPDTELAFPGVAVTAPPGVEGASDPTAIVRLLAPSTSTTATVTVRSGDREVATREVPLEAGLPLELDLGALAIGQYSVHVTADAAVVGGVWTTTGFGEGDDFAWHMPAPRLEGPALVAVAAGPSPVLTLASPAGEAVTVTLTADAGAGPAQQIVVPAGGTARVEVSEGALYRLEAPEPIRAAVGYAGEGALAAYPVWPADAAASPLVVHP
ncbi:DUF5719 family protein [Microbacterium sp. zg-Y818]|uniref:DUF5719 family protein n=1 Tax=unclassified Microbacterium TaxID=2609290 RepID=UPI00214AB9B6|nr:MULTISPECIES: DUF5719 family protein [unclassified Microbacterium]MCR2801697.1 DUF5719 family protein [Microbacterium sp. zg.Y818]WIM23036.1 DUF5719 family protein [Microbacterium sp. zg-Y818]